MYTLPKYACARRTPRLLACSIPLMAALVSAGCQHGVTNLDQTAYSRQIRDADGLLLESDRRFIVMQFTNTNMGGVIDSDSAVAYVSLPIDPDRGLDFRDPGLAVGWSSVSVVFSDLFAPKSGERGKLLPRDWQVPDYWEPDRQLLLEASLERNAIHDRRGVREVGVGEQLEILDYASLIRESLYQVEFAGADPKSSSTD
jgi:hypothetical protein